MTAVLFVIAAAASAWAGLRDLGPGPAPPARSSRSRSALGRFAHLLGARVRLVLPRETADLMIAAGLARPGFDDRGVMGTKVALAVAGLCVGVMLGFALPGRLGVVGLTIGPVAGFLTPDLWLRRLVRNRHRQVRRELPAAIDLLRVGLGAGLSPGRAIAAVARHGDGILAREWRAIDAQAELGQPLGEGLADLAVRIPFPEIDTLTAALARALQLGSPLDETLAVQARGAREARGRAIREGAAKAGPKIQLAVAMLLVPSVMLMVAAALVAALAGSGASLI